MTDWKQAKWALGQLVVCGPDEKLFDQVATALIAGEKAEQDLASYRECCTGGGCATLIEAKSRADAAESALADIKEQYENLLCKEPQRD